MFLAHLFSGDPGDRAVMRPGLALDTTLSPGSSPDERLPARPLGARLYLGHGESSFHVGTLQIRQTTQPQDQAINQWIYNKAPCFTLPPQLSLEKRNSAWGLIITTLKSLATSFWDVNGNFLFTLRLKVFFCSFPF